ncbi:transposase [Imperialibacter roseus]|uniref:Transposase n=1 Tax=Imperialibacter roseus TaxID=1324217 RepID=A0ABZ0IKT0_9BACT|nr:transposase [Imperialibacter roseus]WOK04925.1 transposase [Imperialibacter roseus]
MTVRRRKFDKEFKQMAVNLCVAGKSSSDVADELGVRRELVGRWRREFERFGEGSFSGHGQINLTSEQKEIAKLKKELREAQLERDILKKAVSIFSKGDTKYYNS